MRKVLYISGTRADFGLMESTLNLINAVPALEISVVVTGMHLSKAYGSTIDEIEASAIPVAGIAETHLSPENGATMARAIGKMVTDFTDIFDESKPDIVLLLGDRGEMLAAAIAAVHLNIAVVHVHGGERSGTVDELVRHAVSKLSHVHCVATEQSKRRLISMGEDAERVFVTGAPGLDNLENVRKRTKEEIFRQYALNPDQPFGLFLYHPVVQEAENASHNTGELLDTILKDGWQLIALTPNSDAGSSEIRKHLDACNHPRLNVMKHLPREDFISFLSHADVLIGNSSAGIIEAASFGIP